MKYSALTYLIGEGFANVFKNRKQATISIGTMVITMLIFGIFFVIGQNLNHFVAEVEADQGIQVYMSEKATEAQIKKLGEDLLAMDGINTIKFVSQAESLQKLKNDFGENADLLEGYDETIFPVSYRITLTDLKLSENIQKQILKLDNVTDIGSSDETIVALVKIANGIKIGTYVLSACLIIFAVFIITNTIRLTVNARKREISIMKYVGATNSFIRWPFAVEGMLIGLISGTISIAILAGVYTLCYNNEGFVAFFSKLSLTLLHFTDMLNSIIIVFLILGIGIGVLGSTISMRKYLKV